MNKSIKCNVIFDSIYKILNIIFPLITSMYLARILSPTGIGRISYAQNIVSYFTVVASLGIPTYGIREIAKVKEKCDKKNLVFTELFVINFISTIFCSITYYLIIIISDFNIDKRLFGVCGLLIILNIFNVDWLYQGEEEYKFIAIRSFIIKVISFILVIVLVRKQNDYIIYALIYSGALGGNYLLNIINCNKLVKLKFKNICIFRHFKSIFIMFATVVSVEIYTQLDTTMIGIMCNDEAVAYYTYAMKAIRLISTVFSSFSAVLLPRLSYYYAQSYKNDFNGLINKVFNILILLCVPATIGIYCIADKFVVLLYGQAFSLSAVTMKILAVLILVLSIGNLFGTQVLITVGQEKKLLYSTIVGAILNVVLNALLIPVLAQNGAAIASVICEIIVLLYQYYQAKKYVIFNNGKKDYISICIASVILFLIEIIIKQVALNSVIYIILSGSIGCIVYFGILFLMKNKILYLVLDMLNIKK